MALSNHMDLVVHEFDHHEQGDLVNVGICLSVFLDCMAYDFCHDIDADLVADD